MTILRVSLLCAWPPYIHLGALWLSGQVSDKRCKESVLSHAQIGASHIYLFATAKKTMYP